MSEKDEIQRRAQDVFDDLCADPEVWATHGMPGEHKEALIVARIEKRAARHRLLQPRWEGERMSMQLDELNFMAWLRDECGYVSPVPIGGDRYAAIGPLLFHWTMYVGRIGDRSGVDTRYCYADHTKAEAGLAEWAARKFAGEPTGWHRDTRTGRRRENGDPATDIVAP